MNVIEQIMKYFEIRSAVPKFNDTRMKMNYAMFIESVYVWKNESEVNLCMQLDTFLDTNKNVGKKIGKKETKQKLSLKKKQ